MLARSTRWPLLVVLIAAFTLSHASPGKAHMISCDPWKNTHASVACAKKQKWHAFYAVRWVRNHKSVTLRNPDPTLRTKARLHYRGHVWLLRAMRKRIAAYEASLMPSSFSKWKRLVIYCEAVGVHNPWYANTGNGFYFGPQFTSGTWKANGGAPFREGFGRGPSMRSFSIAYIVRIADNTLHSQGPGAWPLCHAEGYI